MDSGIELIWFMKFSGWIIVLILFSLCRANV
jgi:hypothetical protein